MAAISIDSDKQHRAAMSFWLDQNASSRLSLVLCPSTTTDRFTSANSFSGSVAGVRTSRCLIIICTPSATQAQVFAGKAVRFFSRTARLYRQGDVIDADEQNAGCPGR